RRSCCACCRTARSCAWAAPLRSRSTCAWWLPPIACCATRSRRDASPRISSSGWTASPPPPRPPARAPPTSPPPPPPPCPAPRARHFLARRAAEAGRRLAFSPEAEAALAAHPWPGNVRELENAVERGVVLARGEQVAPEDLLLFEATSSPVAAAPGGTLHDAIDHATAARIRAALEAAGGNRAEAARALGIDRTTLYRLMRRVGVS